MYKITDNRYDPNQNGLDKEGWKEKDVYDPSGMPTGNCWSVLEGALCQINLLTHCTHYSKQVEYIMNRSSYPKSSY